MQPQLEVTREQLIELVNSYNEYSMKVLKVAELIKQLPEHLQPTYKLQSVALVQAYEGIREQLKNAVDFLIDKEKKDGFPPSLEMRRIKRGLGK